MTFNQWAAGKEIDTSSRLAFEAVWGAMVDGGVTGNEAGRLLSDLYESIPEFKSHDDGEDW